MLIASGFSWFHLIPGVEEGTLFPWAHDHGYIAVSAWAVCLVAILFAIVARAGLTRAQARGGLDQYVPEEKLGALTVAEVIVGALYGLMTDLMDKKYARAFLPLIAGLFSYIFISNLFALFPGFQPPTDNINTNIGMAIIVMLTYMGTGLALDPAGFIKHLLGPVLLLSPLFLTLELISYLAVRPGSLAVRLTGNIFGDHTVFNIMSQLSADLLFYAPVPVIFLALATLVSLIQAGVFSLLTTIYISQSLPHGDHDHH
jgi:F-type H+-transporting ATPase subunit a